jgi:hypothetical protein
MTPEELSLEAEKDIKDGVLPWQSKLKRHLLDFKEHLLNQELAPLTIKSRMTGVYACFWKNFMFVWLSLIVNQFGGSPLFILFKYLFNTTSAIRKIPLRAAWTPGPAVILSL